MVVMFMVGWNHKVLCVFFFFFFFILMGGMGMCSGTSGVINIYVNKHSLNDLYCIAQISHMRNT